MFITDHCCQRVRQRFKKMRRWEINQLVQSLAPTYQDGVHRFIVSPKGKVITYLKQKVPSAHGVK